MPQVQREQKQESARRERTTADLALADVAGADEDAVGAPALRRRNLDLSTIGGRGWTMRDPADGPAAEAERSRKGGDRDGPRAKKQNSENARAQYGSRAAPGRLRKSGPAQETRAVFIGALTAASLTRQRKTGAHSHRAEDALWPCLPPVFCRLGSRRRGRRGVAAPAQREFTFCAHGGVLQSG